MTTWRPRAVTRTVSSLRDRKRGQAGPALDDALSVEALSLSRPHELSAAMLLIVQTGSQGTRAVSGETDD